MHNNLHKKPRRFTFLFILLGTVASICSYTIEYTKEITDKYISSFNISQEKTDVILSEQTGFLQKLKTTFIPQRIKLSRQPLTHRQARETACIAAPTKPTKGANIDADFADKMKLVHGGQRPQDNYISRLTTIKLSDGSEKKLTSTIMGEKAVVERITQPPSDFNEIITTQSAVKELVANSSLRNFFIKTLTEMQNAESHLLAFFKPEDEGTKKAISGPYFSDWFGNSINTNATALETKMRLGNLLQFISLTAPVVGIASGRIFYEHKIKNKPWKDSITAGGKQVVDFVKFLYPGKRVFKNGLPKIIKAFFSSIYIDKHDKSYRFSELTFFEKLRQLPPDELIQEFKNIGIDDPATFEQEFEKNPWKNKDKILQKIVPQSLGDTYEYADQFSEKLKTSKLKGRALVTSYIAGPALLYSYSTWGTITRMRNTADILNFVHGKLVNVANYIKSAERLYGNAKNNTHLVRAIPELKEIAHLTNKSYHSPAFVKLIHMLKSYTFTSVSAFSRSGRVLAAYKLIYQVKDEFANLLRAIGKIDSLTAVAQLYEAYKTNNASYCFIEFIQQDTPYFYAEDFWNPFINPKIVVTNTIELGGNKPRSMILTGPNTGGKSTLIEGALLAAYGQCWGIGPAKKIVMTPFAKFTCYHNITDDISLGDSRFKSEVLQSKKQLKTAQDLNPGEFSFNIRDEGIVGTDREVGCKAEYAFTKQLGELPNSINLMSTHYPELTNLEPAYSNLFKNYYMEIIKHDDTKIERTFTLRFGISTINIAMNILHEEGVL